MLRWLGLAAGLMLLGGCAVGYDVDAPVEPAAAAASPAGAKLAGRYLLVIRAEPLSGAVAPSAYHCNADYLTLDAAPAFRQSVEGQIRQLVASVDLGPAPLSTAELRAQGFDGQIVVDALPLDLGLDFERRFWFERRHFIEFWHAASTAEIDVAARISLQDRSGAMWQTRVAAERTWRNGDGFEFACDNGAEALGTTTHDALVGLNTAIAERFASLGAGAPHWLAVDGVGQPVSDLAAALAGKTFYLHTSAGEPVSVVDYFDPNWRFVRRAGRCDRVGSWSVRHGTAGEELCLSLPGDKPSCFAVAGLPEEPAYVPLDSADERPVLTAWKTRDGNGEELGLESRHCKAAIPF